jgi:hypothetical protein
LQPAAEFLELGLTPSDSEKFLTPPISNGFSPKGSRSEQLRLFTIPSKMTIGTLNKNSRRPFPPTNLEKNQFLKLNLIPDPVIAFNPE